MLQKSKQMHEMQQSKASHEILFSDSKKRQVGIRKNIGSLELSMKPIVELFVEPLNRHVRFLLDTGSDVSLIAESLCKTDLDIRPYAHSVASIPGD